MSKDLGIAVPENTIGGSYLDEQVKAIIKKTHTLKGIKAIAAPRIILGNGQGASILTGQETVLPILGDRGTTAQIDYKTGIQAGFDKVTLSSDKRQLTLSLSVKSVKDLTPNEAGHYETEIAEYDGIASVPVGQSLLLRTPFIKTQIVGILQPGDFAGKESGQRPKF